MLTLLSPTGLFYISITKSLLHPANGSDGAELYLGVGFYNVQVVNQQDISKNNFNKIFLLSPLEKRGQGGLKFHKENQTLIGTFSTLDLPTFSLYPAPSTQHPTSSIWNPTQIFNIS